MGGRKEGSEYQKEAEKETKIGRQSSEEEEQTRKKMKEEATSSTIAFCHSDSSSEGIDSDIFGDLCRQVDKAKEEFEAARHQKEDPEDDIPPVRQHTRGSHDVEPRPSNTNRHEVDDQMIKEEACRRKKRRIDEITLVPEHPKRRCNASSRSKFIENLKLQASTIKSGRAKIQHNASASHERIHKIRDGDCSSRGMGRGSVRV